MGVRHFKELRCWQLSSELKREVYAITAHPPCCADRDFCSDIRDAARSAAANIAEGFGRYTHREFGHFLSIAHASLSETENHLLDAEDGGYISADECARLTDLAQRAQKAVSRLRTYLLNTPKQFTR
jgi:four helix bundle protein